MYDNTFSTTSKSPLGDLGVIKKMCIKIRIKADGNYATLLSKYIHQREYPNSIKKIPTPCITCCKSSRNHLKPYFFVS